MVLGALVVISAEGCATHVRPASAPKSPTRHQSTAFVATAYCTGHVTASGTKVAAGTVAADPRILPIGSVITIRRSNTQYDGTYNVLDTGPNIRGRRVDIYMRNCRDAVKFGRRRVEVRLMREAD